MTQRAYRMDPLSPVVGASLAMILYLARKYDQAVTVLLSAQEISPDHFLPHMRMGLVRIQQRKYEQAIQELKTAVRLAEPRRSSSPWVYAVQRSPSDLANAVGSKLQQLPASNSMRALQRRSKWTAKL